MAKKIDAEQMSMEGDKYLGRLYSDMDCQEFFERCAKDVGLDMNLAGSNAWFRDFIKNGWVGEPELCKAQFGCVPPGAALFIVKQDGGEVERGYKDGKGNATHIGMNTGRTAKDMVRRAAAAGVKDPEQYNFGDGAIHSSSSRKHVCTSKFEGKTIPNGGWNMVGLSLRFTYGEEVDRILCMIKDVKYEDPAEEQGGKQEEKTMYTAILEGGVLDSPINIRKKPNGDLQDKLPQGSKVTVLDEDGNWCKIEYTKKGKKYTGYVNGNFVTVYEGDEDPTADDSGIPAEDFDDNDTVKITLSMTAAEARTVLPVLEKLVDGIVDKMGRG